MKRVEKFTSDDILDRIGNRHAVGLLLDLLARLSAIAAVWR